MNKNTIYMESLIESKEELSEELCNFLECAIHNILYTREVYPTTLFKKVRMYNVPVWKCRHPDVVSYVKDMVDSIRPLFGRGLVDKFCLVICENCDGDSISGGNRGISGKEQKHAKRKPLEQYTFSIKLLDQLTHCTRASLDTFLRSLLLKINVADGSFAPLNQSQNLSFFCLIHTNDDLTGEDQRRMQACLENPWITADDDEDVRGVFEGDDVVPFKTISTQAFILQLHVEQLH